MLWTDKLEENIADRDLARDGQRLLVGVSGGVDSMVLLSGLQALADKHRWKLQVAHFNHQLRGRSSDADERLVRQFAAKYHLPVIVGTRDVKRFAATKKLSIEMAARQLRHEFFASIARRKKVATIALAHHADDRVELFLLRLLRGSGSEGLSGMKWSSPSPVDQKVGLIRPLLNFSKTEILAIAEENRIPFREDATNAQTDFLRNRVRHEVIPVLRAVQPAMSRTILRAIDIIGEEGRTVASIAAEWLAASQPSPFAELAVAVQRKTIELQLRNMGAAADFESIERLRLAANQPVTIGNRLHVMRDNMGRVRSCEAIPEFERRIRKVSLSRPPFTVAFGGVEITWDVKNMQGQAFERRTDCEIFDADRVGDQVTLRHWRPGDRFWPIGMKAPVKLQDIFVNQKVPRDIRRSLVLATTRKGEIFWVEGLRIAEGFKLTSSTRRRLSWCFRRAVSVVAADKHPC